MKEKELGDKEQLVELLIHDLTGPLSIAYTSTDNLLHKAGRYGPLTDAQKRVVERSLRNIRKAQALLHEMIEISRSEEGIFKKESLEMRKVLKEALIDALEANDSQAAERLIPVEDPEELENMLRTQRISLEMNGKYCNAPFCHDHRKVRQILRNLIGNALKYRRAEMRVCIQGDQDLLISIEDDGYGIPPNAQEAVFKRFVRLRDKRCGDVPGYGLGLAGVKSLVEAMGGEISLESREGAGTCFKIRVPPLQG
jgi:signal transduction histidine kinase